MAHRNCYQSFGKEHISAIYVGVFRRIPPSSTMNEFEVKSEVERVVFSNDIDLEAYLLGLIVNSLDPTTKDTSWRKRKKRSGDPFLVPIENWYGFKRARKDVLE